jgi:hypothetical protein
MEPSLLLTSAEEFLFMTRKLKNTDERYSMRFKAIPTETHNFLSFLTNFLNLVTPRSFLQRAHNLYNI